MAERVTYTRPERFPTGRIVDRPGVDRMVDLTDRRAGLVPRDPKSAPAPYRYRDGRCAGALPPMTGKDQSRRIRQTALARPMGKVEIIRNGEVYKPGKNKITSLRTGQAFYGATAGSGEYQD